MQVTWSDEKLILLYFPGRGSNSRPTAHRSFKHGQGVLRPYLLGHGDMMQCRQRVVKVTSSRLLHEGNHKSGDNAQSRNKVIVHTC